MYAVPPDNDVPLKAKLVNDIVVMVWVWELPGPGVPKGHEEVETFTV
jgi:hypothetical protein